MGSGGRVRGNVEKHCSGTSGARDAHGSAMFIMRALGLMLPTSASMSLESLKQRNLQELSPATGNSPTPAKSAPSPFYAIELHTFPFKAASLDSRLPVYREVFSKREASNNHSMRFLLKSVLAPSLSPHAFRFKRLGLTRILA